MSDLFSWQSEKEAARLRDDGMSRAAAGQENRMPGFSDLAYAALLELARHQPEIHIDHFLQFFPLRPEQPNAFGAVWMRAARNCVIEKTGRTRRCATDTRKHAHDYPIYRSLIFKEGSDG